MAKEEVAEQQEESKPWWAIDKAAWKERLSGFYRLASIADGRDAPLRRWSDADVEEFMNTDPVYGPQVIFISSFFFFSLFTFYMYFFSMLLYCTISKTTTYSIATR